MSNAFQRTLLSSLIASAFVVGANVALAADPATPSSNAGASTSATSAQPSAGTSATTSGTGTGTTSSATTTMGTGATSATTTGPTSGATSSTASTQTPAAAPGDSDARRIFDQLDTNHDGVLSFDEFSRATIRHQ